MSPTAAATAVACDGEKASAGPATAMSAALKEPKMSFRIHMTTIPFLHVQHKCDKRPMVLSVPKSTLQMAIVNPIWWDRSHRSVAGPVLKINC